MAAPCYKLERGTGRFVTLHPKSILLPSGGQAEGEPLKALSKFARLGLVIAVPALLVMSAVPAGAKTKAPKPTITGFTANPSTVSTTNGNVTLSATVANGTSCVFSVVKGGAVPGLPHTTPCSSGTVSDTVAFPFNYGTKALKYKVQLNVTGSTKSKDANTDVSVDGDDGSPDPKVTPVQGDPYNSIGASFGANDWTKSVTGSDFAPNESVDLTVNGDAVGNGTTDDEGNLTGTLTVPTVPDGDYELVATGQTAGDSATTTLGVGWDIYFEYTSSCSGNVDTLNGTWEGDGLDASSFYTLTLTNGQQTEAESDSSGSVSAPFSFTADGGTSQTFTWAGPYGGQQTTITTNQQSMGTC